jgi:hypothetical protein
MRNRNSVSDVFGDADESDRRLASCAALMRCAKCQSRLRTPRGCHLRGTSDDRASVLEPPNHTGRTARSAEVG